MHDDFGDDAGEKMVDWMMKIGQERGRAAAVAAASQLKDALKNARGQAAGSDEVKNGSEWAKLDMVEFQAIEGWPELRELVSDKLKADGIEHEYFDEPQGGKTYLVFRLADAGRVAGSLEQLEGIADAARDKAAAQLERMEHDREQDKCRVKGRDLRDTERLKDKAMIALKASGAVERGEVKVADRVQTQDMQQVRTR
ncbi:MAG: hypothetical protein RR842_04920 [Gordonibacter sp.]|uniref:hypothetical protein n=1 Tax=Gordonibacter sp. TaxID=1968902 RepID=UPI002B374318|nr:hypothetical protein [Gordonibacter sp.]